MAAIAIIDDNLEQSSTLAKTIEHYLKKNGSDLSLITQFPFRDLDGYLKFVEDSEVCVLILDEKLNDQPTPEGGPVDYKGNELVTFLRERLKDFPIFMISNYIGDEDLGSKFSEFDYMLTRNEIAEEGEKYIPIIVRSAHRYLSANNKELSEYNLLTREIAAGNSTPEKIERLQALQVKLDIPLTGFDDRKTWLEEYESHIKELEILKNDLLNKIKGE